MFLCELTKGQYCEDIGRSSIDPTSFFRMQLIHLYCIRYGKQACEGMHLIIAYR
jgi:hypothetical protein